MSVVCKHDPLPSFPARNLTYELDQSGPGWVKTGRRYSQFAQIRIGDQDTGFSIVKDKRQVFSDQPVIERHEDGTGMDGREVGFEHAVAVFVQQAETIAGFDSPASEGSG